MVRHDIALLVAHTNLDSAPGGVNDGLAGRLGLTDLKVLEPRALDESNLKLVTFVPEADLDAVRQSIGDAGGGVIGNYTHCAYACLGEGSFIPTDAANPHIGEAGTLERVQEARLEVEVKRELLDDVLKALRAAHPYEEVPIDVYARKDLGLLGSGIGRIGKLELELNAEEFVRHVQNSLKLSYCRMAGNTSGTVRRVAVVGGSGGGYIHRAHALGADALVTGDVSYHQADEAASLGMLVVDAGHFGTEKHVPWDLADAITRWAEETGRKIHVGTAWEEDVFRVST